MNRDREDSMSNVMSDLNREATSKISLGICAMDKKARSKPMTEILGRLPEDLFEIHIFGDECILNEPVENWPVVECLIAFYSGGYPLDKALEYVELRHPFLVNDLEMQKTLMDRRLVYEVLQSCDIPVPRHVYVNRDEHDEDHNVLEEFDDYIVINGTQINKPFVEKPVDADDHNIYIYYPLSAGGGSKRLFRKIKDRSSEFYPDVNEVRRQGSYIYEEFLNTQGTDVKVYTVGANYGHAEARKSPVVDGKVHRSSTGHEVRYPVILSPTEKEITQKITTAFKQTVCGFDFLRAPGKKSYVCDVNGWSFVKNSRKYYDDASRVLCETMLLALRPEFRSTLSTVQPLTRNPSTTPQSDSTGDRQSGTQSGSGASPVCDEELLCVISVIRHADRTPKQKMKVKLADERFLDFFHEHAPSPVDNVKLKSKKSLIRFLELTKSIIDQGDEGMTDKELFSNLLRIRDVLERHKISGINRKLQMKPEKWRDTVVTDADGKQLVETRATEILLILKWGGDLTPLGEQQAVDLGTSFRSSMYPESDGGGVLRLHSTFRHDLKIKASDEGRVMKTAAAFTKGLLELEGGLTPVLVSLVTVQEKDNQMLDHYDNLDIKQEVSKCKNYLNRVLQMDTQFTEDMLYDIAPISSSFMRSALLKLGNPRNTLARMHSLIGQLCVDIEDLRSREDSSEPPPPLYLGETYALMADRWDKLNKDFFRKKIGTYDLTKVPEVYDMCRYDILHNSHLALGVLDDLFRVSELFADCVVPQEYGIDENEKRTIGIKMCHALLRKIQYDLNAAKSATQMDMQFLLDLSHGDDLRIRTLGRCVRTRLYFTSESHLYTLLNVLMYPPRGSAPVVSAEGARVIDNTKELSYLSQISFRLFDNRSRAPNDPKKYRCEISFSAGACADPTLQKSVYLAPHVILNRNIPCDDLIRTMNAAISECDSSRSTSSQNDLSPNDGVSATRGPVHPPSPPMFSRSDSRNSRF